jgi:Flp pilus assembly pilin Flp
LDLSYLGFYFRSHARLVQDGEGAHVKIDISAMKKKIVELLRADRGQAITEYALICALLACGVTAGYTGVAQAVDSAFNKISGTLSTALSLPSN